jgi:hypothetical protein
LHSEVAGTKDWQQGKQLGREQQCSCEAKSKTLSCTMCMSEAQAHMPSLGLEFRFGLLGHCDTATCCAACAEMSQPERMGTLPTLADWLLEPPASQALMTTQP